MQSPDHTERNGLAMRGATIQGYPVGATLLDGVAARANECGAGGEACR